MGISIKSAIELIKVAPPDAIIGLVGPPGYGKSAAPAIAAAESGWHYVCRYLALMEAVEINGLPHLVSNGDDKQGRWAPFAGLFPLESDSAQYDGKTVLLCLDDLGQAAPSVTKAGVRVAYGDGIERMVGMQSLYRNTRIVFTSNLHTHRAGAHRFESYVGNRVTIVEIDPDPEQWCTWALEHGVNPSIVAYVKFTKKITDFASDKDAFMSPRSLVKLSGMVDALDRAGINGPVLRAVTFGTIGEQAGTEFIAFHSLASELPDMDAVLDGKPFRMPTRPEVQYMFASTLLGATTEKHVPLVARIINLMTEGGGDHGFEVAAYITFEALKGSATKLRGLRSRTELYEWIHKYGQYLP